MSTAKEATFGYSVFFEECFSFNKGEKLPSLCKSQDYPSGIHSNSGLSFEMVEIARKHSAVRVGATLPLASPYALCGALVARGSSTHTSRRTPTHALPPTVSSATSPRNLSATPWNECDLPNRRFNTLRDAWQNMNSLQQTILAIRNLQT